jgi:phage terminase small subunit
MGTEVFPRLSRRPRISQADGRQASCRTSWAEQDVIALTAKQEAFAVACAKGGSASIAYRAAYAAGNMSAAAVHVAACRLSKNPKVALRVAELREPALKSAGLEIEETLRQLACVLRSDPRRLFRPDGSFIPIHELDDATAAAISNIELDEQGRPKKIRLWSKTDAIEKAMRHLGAFERDNRQKSENLAIQINLVGAPPEPIEQQRQRQATDRRRLQANLR